MSTEEQTESGFFTRKKILVISLIFFLIIVLIFILHTWSGYWLLSLYYNYPSCEEFCETIHEFTPLWFTGNGILMYIESQTPTTGYESPANYTYFEVEPKFIWLGDKGKAAFPFIIKGLRTKHVYLRLIMLCQIFIMSWSPDTLSNEGDVIELKDEIMVRLQDKHPSVRMMAFRALFCFEIPDAKMLDIAETMKDDENEVVAKTAQDYIDEINGVNTVGEEIEIPNEETKPEKVVTPKEAPKIKRELSEQEKEMIRDLVKRMNE